MFILLQAQKLHTTHFVDAFQGYYEDSTEPGTCDCRWFAAVYFLGRMMVIYIVFGITEGETCYSLIGISMIFLGVVMITLQPYRSRKANTYNTILILFTAVACFSITLFNDTEVEAHSIAGIVLTLLE